MWPNPQYPADFFTFTEEILSGQLPFLCISHCLIYFTIHCFKRVVDKVSPQEILNWKQPQNLVKMLVPLKVKGYCLTSLFYLRIVYEYDKELSCRLRESMFSVEYSKVLLLFFSLLQSLLRKRVIVA